MFRELALQWTPPIVRSWLLRQFGGVRFVSQWPSTSLTGWQDAAEEAAKGYSKGVHHVVQGIALGFSPEDSLVKWPESGKQLHDRLVQLALVVARTAYGREFVRLLDFGGAFGVHAFGVTRLLPDIRCEYTVCELPPFCDIGQKLNPKARFVSGLDSAGDGYHLVYASGAVQYSHDWRKLIADLCRASAANVFISRTPFTFDQPTFVTVQRAYKTEYPGWVFNYDEFIQEFPRHGMTPKEVFVNGPGIPVRGMSAPNVHLGLLFQRSNYLSSSDNDD